MKQKKSAVNLIAGIVFLYMAYSAVNMVFYYIIHNRSITDGLSDLLRFHSPLQLLITIYRFVLLLILAVYALRQKKRGRILNILAIIDIALTGISLLAIVAYGSYIRGWLNLAAYIVAFTVTGKAGGALFPAEDNISEAAKAKIQAEKQNAMYAEQLQSGILTQEEYNQIMENKI